MNIFKHIAIVLVMSLHVYAEGSNEACKPSVMVHNFSSGQKQGAIHWNSTPAFVGYRNGDVIWRKGMENSVDAFFKSHHESAKEMVKKIEALVANHNGKTFTLTASSDHTGVDIWANGKVIQIFGNWREPIRLEAFSQDEKMTIDQVNEDEKKKWLSLPNEIRMLLTSIVDFNPPDKVKWCPEKIILSLQEPLIGTPQSKVIWPKEWPRTFVPDSRGRFWRKVILQGTMLGKILEKIPDDGQPRAIVLDDEIRYPNLRLIFPGEEE